VPLLGSVLFLLPVPALVGSRTSAVPQVSIYPLLLKHCNKRGEERSRNAGKEQCLDSDNFWRGSGPGDEVGVRVGEEGVVHGVDGELHVGGGHVVRIRLEF